MGDGSKHEPLRRWSPKPEQIKILESIFNTGIVNPTQDQTKNIRKLLEKFGPVGEASIFYWFQNRRSRFRRRHRKAQEAIKAQPQPAITGVGFEPNSGSSSSPRAVDGSDTFTTNTYNNNTYNDLFSCFAPPPDLVQEYYHDPAMFFSADYSALNYPPPEAITVFINGIETQVKRECLHVTNMFGSDCMMCDSSGIPLPVNENGVLAHSLEHGLHYILVQHT